MWVSEHKVEKSCCADGAISDWAALGALVRDLTLQALGDHFDRKGVRVTERNLAPTIDRAAGNERN